MMMMVLGGCGGDEGGGTTSAASSTSASTSTGASSTGASTGGEQVCVPGIVQPCGCPGGGIGMQTCAADGFAFGACTGCDTGQGGNGGGGGAGGAPAGACGNYPAAPYGTSKGDTIANYQFNGYPNAAKDATVLKPIELCDFYNPTGTETFPAGSSYGTGAKPKALFFSVFAAWAAPCNFEAKTELPPRHLQYKPMGGEFMMLLADSATPGKPAVEQNLFNWDKKYGVDFPSVIDPAQTQGPVVMAFPTGFMVDLHTMKIVDVIVGVPNAAAWTKFEGLL